MEGVTHVGDELLRGIQILLSKDLKALEFEYCRLTMETLKYGNKFALNIWKVPI